MFSSDAAIALPTPLTDARGPWRRRTAAREQAYDGQLTRQDQLGGEEATARDQWLSAFAHCPVF